jgi:steroid delta-isomerase-like uncharacterized protein
MQLERRNIMSEPNRTLMRRAIEEVWNRGNFALVDELVASDFVGHSDAVGHPEPAENNEPDGPEGYKQYFAMLRGAFPDIHFTIEDQITEGDRVVTRWVARATHKGAFQGIPPTGNQGVVTGITIYRVANGKFVEGWTNLDALGMQQQLGILPAPGQAG